jgi:hypothetical protein
MAGARSQTDDLPRQSAALVEALLEGDPIAMDLNNVLAQLRAERDAIAAAISNLERLAQGRHRGPGRPPGFVTKSAATNDSSRPSPSPASAPSKGPSRSPTAASTAHSARRPRASSE